jgi:membrane protein implicated in regulation of membrane protease activity
VSDQTRITSLIEVCMSTAIGFVVSALAWPVIAFWMGYPYTLSHTLQVTTFYTVLSVARGYLVRRFFARDMHNAAVRIGRRLISARQ